MMTGMMAECCSAEGMPDFEKMKIFMEDCGKKEFSATELEKMREFCSCEGKPDFEKIETFMKECSCCVPSDNA